MVTISLKGVSLSIGSAENGFPPIGVAKVYKVQTHEGDFAACDLGRKRRQERRQRLATKSFYLNSRD